MIDNTLIERALALCDKTFDDMVDCDNLGLIDYQIEKFGYYLLSPEFIERYDKIEPTGWGEPNSCLFGLAIADYQLGNEEPLVALLSKI